MEPKAKRKPTKGSREVFPEVLYIIRSWDCDGEPIYDARESVDNLDPEGSDKVAIYKLEQVKTLKVIKQLL